MDKAQQFFRTYFDDDYSFQQFMGRYRVETEKWFSRPYDAETRTWGKRSMLLQLNVYDRHGTLAVFADKPCRVEVSKARSVAYYLRRNISGKARVCAESGYEYHRPAEFGPAIRSIQSDSKVVEDYYVDGLKIKTQKLVKEIQKKYAVQQLVHVLALVGETCKTGNPFAELCKQYLQRKREKARAGWQ